MGREILRCAQDDRAVLPTALWPTRAHVRLRLMPIIADLSAPQARLPIMNFNEMGHYALASLAYNTFTHLFCLTLTVLEVLHQKPAQ